MLLAVFPCLYPKDFRKGNPSPSPRPTKITRNAVVQMLRRDVQTGSCVFGYCTLPYTVRHVMRYHGRHLLAEVQALHHPVLIHWANGKNHSHEGGWTPEGLQGGQEYAPLSAFPEARPLFRSRHHHHHPRGHPVALPHVPTITERNLLDSEAQDHLAQRPQLPV